MADVLIFPGQGSQKIGMASAFINGFKSAMEVMEEIEEAISFKISTLIAEGSLEELSKTENSQPAIFAVEMVCVSVLEKEYGYDIKDNCKYLAGHSLGEYAALCVAGAFSVPDAAKLVKTRGELMAKACSNALDYSMEALIGICATEIEELVRPYQSGRNICVIANDNSEFQVVISGDKNAVRTVCEKAKAAGATKSIELNVSGPFHSPLMAKAAIGLDSFLSKNIIANDCQPPVITNISAEPLKSGSDIHNCLVRQITGRVRWRETVDFLMKDPEIKNIAEIAPGKVLSSMINRSYPKAKVFNLETVSQIEEFLKAKSR